MRTALRDRDRIVIGRRLDHEQPADDFLALGERTVGDDDLAAAVASHGPSFMVAQLVPASEFAGALQLVAPRAIPGDDRLDSAGENFSNTFPSSRSINVYCAIGLSLRAG